MSEVSKSIRLIADDTKKLGSGDDVKRLLRRAGAGVVGAAVSTFGLVANELNATARHPPPFGLQGYQVVKESDPTLKVIFTAGEVVSLVYTGYNVAKAVWVSRKYRKQT